MNRDALWAVTAVFFLCHSFVPAQALETGKKTERVIPLRLYFTAPHLLPMELGPNETPPPFLPQHSGKFKAFQKWGLRGMVIGMSTGFVVGLVSALSRDYEGPGGPLAAALHVGAYTLGGMFVGIAAGVVAFIIFESWKEEWEFE